MGHYIVLLHCNYVLEIWNKQLLWYFANKWSVNVIITFKLIIITGSDINTRVKTWCKIIEVAALKMETPNSNITDQDFFHFMMVNSPSKVVSLVFSLLCLIIVPAVLYSLVWFDSFGSDKKRTFINRLFSSFCAVLIEMCFTIQFTEIIR